jgi:hypothetical protein
MFAKRKEVTQEDSIRSALFLSVQAETLTRAGLGRVRFLLENTSAVETEIVTALQNGTQPSPEIRFQVLDRDDNVLSVQPFQQGVGAAVISLPTGDTVARVAPGATFASDWVDIPIPASAPDIVRIRVVIDSFHYKLGTNEHSGIEGQVGSLDATLVDPPYNGQLVDIAPGSSFGKENIVITGQALERGTATLLPNVRLSLILSVRGFERVFTVFTDAGGQFQFVYTPQPGEAGVYAVSVIHPDLRTRPEQGHFTINSILVAPTRFVVRVPKNYRIRVHPRTLRQGRGKRATSDTYRLCQLGR